MKKIWGLLSCQVPLFAINTTLFLCLFFSIPVVAADSFAVSDTGVISIGGVRLRLEHWDENWNYSKQDSNSFQPDSGFPLRAGGILQWQGKFLLRKSGATPLQLRISGIGSDTLEYCVRMEQRSTRQFAFSAQLPLTDFLHRKIEAGNKKFAFEEKFNPKQRNIAVGNVGIVRIPLEQGCLIISGRIRLGFFDDRYYKNHYNWSLRFSNPESALCEMRYTLKFQPWRSTPLDLRTATNMGFTDDVAGDRRGGWTDQGPENDLSSMKGGVYVFRGVEMRVLDPLKNNGKACIATYGKARPYFPRRTVISGNGAFGRYIYFLHALAWEPAKPLTAGIVRARFRDGSLREFKVTAGHDVGNFWYPAERKHAVAVWFGSNRSCSRVGLYLSRHDLGMAGELESLEVEATGNTVWMVAAASVSPDEIPLRTGEEEKLVISAGAEYQPFYNNKNIAAGSILDFSHFNHCPAGKFGFVRTKGEQLEFSGRPGVPVRFYGANLCMEALFARAELQERMAHHMAQSGYNLARLHHFDRDLASREGRDSTVFDPVKLDRLDYLIKVLRENGIYTVIDLFTLRKLRKGEIAEFPDRDVSFHEFKALLYVSESAMRNWERFAENLLNHVNPYTGSAWKSDPSLVSISLVNENTIDAAYNDAPQIQELFHTRFTEYCRKHSIALTPENREIFWGNFLIELQVGAWKRMSGFLRNLGVTIPLTDQNYGVSPLKSVFRSVLDFSENHSYWNHPRFIAGGWRPPSLVDNRSAVTQYGGNFLKTAPSRLYGKPFALTEWDFCNPYDFTAEGAFLVGAYASLQDWSMIVRFDYATWGGSIRKDEAILDYFDAVNDPVKMLSERAGRLFFERGDVAPSRQEFKFPVNPAGSGAEYPEMMNRFALIGRVGTVFDNRKIELPPLPVDERYFSSTGELLLSADRGIFTVKTPRSEAALLPEKECFSGKVLSVKNLHGFGAFLAAAMDDRPLSSSHRILLLHLTENRNSGQIFSSREKKVMESWGKLPLLVRRGRAEIKLNGDFRQHKLYAVDIAGKRIKALDPVKNNGKSLIFFADTLKNAATPVMVYELVLK